MNVSKILEQNKMSPRAAFYAEQGESMTDLNGDILTGIGETVLAAKGKKAHAGFVNMVADLYFVQKDMSASNFVTALHKLEKNKWTCQQIIAANANDVCQADKHEGSVMRRAIAQDFLLDNKRFLDDERKQRFIEGMQGIQYTVSFPKLTKML